MNKTKTLKDKIDSIQQSESYLLINNDYQLGILSHIFEKCPFLINSKDENNDTFLSCAIKGKNIESGKLILTNPLLDITYKDIKGNTYLHLAVINQLECIVKSLIEKGIDINTRNNDGNTALHFAYSTGNINIISILLEKGGDLKIKNNEGLLPQEIQIDSFPEILDNNIINISNNSNSYDNNIDFSNEKTNELINTILTNNKNKINKTINIDWSNYNIKNNIINSSNNLLKDNLSNDEDNSINKELGQNKNENENNKEITLKLNLGNIEDDNLQNINISDLTNNLTYEKKFINSSEINNYNNIGNQNILSKINQNENSEDMVNIKEISASENEPIYNFLANNSKNKNIYKKVFLRRKGNNKEYYKIENSINDSKQVSNINCANLDKENKDTIKREDKENILNNNQETYITICQTDFNKEFEFSPLATLEEPLNKNQYIDENVNINNKINNYIINCNNKNNKLIFENKQYFKNNKNNNIKITNHKSCNLFRKNPLINVNNNKNFLAKKNSKFNLNLTLSTSEDSKNIYSKSINNSHDFLYIFLSEIKLEKYYIKMNTNGFEDIEFLINQIKSSLTITDSQLKKIGIDIPGDRAKILIRLEEKAGNFSFQVPKSVYYICNEKDNYENDFHIKKLKEWFKEIKIEYYLENFIKAGYHSVELMLLQMESKNPINDTILMEELGIEKIGHRTRIINKLLIDGKSLINKLKSSNITMANEQNEKYCDCIII